MAQHPFNGEDQCMGRVPQKKKTMFGNVMVCYLNFPWEDAQPLITKFQIVSPSVVSPIGHQNFQDKDY